MTLLITLITLTTLGLEPSRTSLVSLPMYIGIGSTVLYFLLLTFTSTFLPFCFGFRIIKQYLKSIVMENNYEKLQISNPMVSWFINFPYPHLFNVRLV